MKTYRVFFHLGDELTLKTCVIKGHASVDAFGLHVDSLATFGRGPQVRVWDGRTHFTIPAADILSAEIFRLHGLGRVIRVDYREGRLFWQ